MYKIIFTDDEAIVRDGISSCIDWKAAGFELVGCFENGRQTLEFLDTNSAHLVISDINMPIMDGLTLSQQLRERHPSVKVVLLTGYDEFEYAREALNNHVSRFLLKPITSEELFTTLQLIHEELDQVHRREEQQEKLRRKLVESMPLLKERFLNRLVRGQMSAESVREQASTLGWTSGGGVFQIAVAAPVEDWNELELLELSEYADSLTEGADEVFRNYDGEIILLLQGTGGDMLEARTGIVCNQLYSYSENINSSRVCIGLGPCCSSIEDFANAYSAARTALRYSASIGLSQVLSAADIQRRERLSTRTFNNHISRLIDTIKTGRMSETEAELNSIFELFESFYLEPEDAEIYLGQLHLQLQQSIEEIAGFSGLSDSDLSAILDARKHGDYRNYREYIRGILNDFEKFIMEQRNHTLEQRLIRARDIIEARFSDKDFSLSDICNELYLSTSQFSHIFKEGMQMTFLEYLTNRRVEEAKLLLKTTDLKGYEVAEQVGFSDPRYFFIVFKKYCGMTAMHFRKSVAG